MYHLLTQILFWFYWAIALIVAALFVREIVRGSDWKTQATAALALMPFLLRALLVK
jgi:hypothetical protein